MHSVFAHDLENYRERLIKASVFRRTAAFELLGEGIEHEAELFVGDGAVAADPLERFMGPRQRAVLRGDDPVGGSEAGVAHAQFAHRDDPQRRVASRLASICAAVKGAAP